MKPCHQIIHYDLERTYYKNEYISDKIKTIDKKIEQNKAQYNLDRETARISALSSGNVSKYEFFTGKDVFPENDLLERATALKRFVYSSLGKELKKQTSAAVKKYQNFDIIFKPNEIEQPVTIKKEKPVTIKKEITDESRLFYNNKYSWFY